jgi:hypothetical protein
MSKQQKIVDKVKGINLMRWFIRSRFAKGFITFAQRKQFLRYKEISWYTVFEFFVRWVDKKDLHLRTSALSFTFFFIAVSNSYFLFYTHCLFTVQAIAR